MYKKGFFMIFVFLMYALLSSTFSIGKILLDFAPPMFLIALRMLIAGTILFFAGIATGSKIKMQRYDFMLFWLAALIHIFIPYASEFWALQTMSPATACLFYNLTPFVAAFFSYLMFNERMTIAKWIGFAIGLGGIMYFMSQGFCFSLLQATTMTDLIMLLSVVSSCLGWVIVRILVKQRGYSPLYVNGLSMLLGGIASLITSYYVEPNYVLRYEDWPTFLILLAIMILIGNVFFYNMYAYLLKRYTVTFLSFAGFVTPLFAAFFEKLFFSTAIPDNFFYAVLIIGVGITIFYFAELRQGYITSEQV